MKRLLSSVTLIAFAAAMATSGVMGCGDSETPVSDTTDDSTMPEDVADDSTAPEDVAGDVAHQTDATGDAATDAVIPPAVTRFVFVSDIHFRTVEGQEKHSKDIGDLIPMINALSGDYDILVTGGDNFDHVLPAWDEKPLESPMAWFVEEMDKLTMPWVAAIGNHEFYDYFGDVPTLTTDGARRGQAFSTVMGHPLYFTTEINGVKLIVLDSMEDGSWGETHGLMGKFSQTQLDWLRAELAQGKPSFLFFHHPPSSLSPNAPGGQLCSVVEEYPGVVKSIFTGHTHGFWRGDYCGAPYYVVEDYHSQVNLWYEIEYDAGTDTVTIWNQEYIDFPEMPEFTCEPGESTIADHELAIGTVQKLDVTNGVSDAEGLGEMLGEGLAQIPFVISFDGYEDGTGYASRMTIASRWEIDNFLTYVAGSPCVEMGIHWKGGEPCFEAGPFNIQAQLISFLSSVSEDPVNPDWKANLDIRNMVFEGCIRNDDNGIPVIADGLVYATILRDPTIADLSRILVDEYCAGRIEGCTPGADSLPACPGTLDVGTYESIFADIRYSCDVQVMGFGLVSLIDMLATLPDETHVTGQISTSVITVSDTPEEGGQASSDLFNAEPGHNCAITD